MEGSIVLPDDLANVNKLLNSGGEQHTVTTENNKDVRNGDASGPCDVMCCKYTRDADTAEMLAMNM